MENDKNAVFIFIFFIMDNIVKKTKNKQVKGKRWFKKMLNPASVVYGKITGPCCKSVNIACYA